MGEREMSRNGFDKCEREEAIEMSKDQRRKHPLNAKQIERFRANAAVDAIGLPGNSVDLICDMALASLTARDEGIEATAKVCEEMMAYLIETSALHFDIAKLLRDKILARRQG